jgi:hypothetical protein
MEHTAVQLMSRKQRAAKLLTGDVGLTGLDALTEGEGGFEQALMDAIAKDEALLDPSEMFKVSAGQSEIDAEDMAYWNVEVADDEPEISVTQDDPLVQVAIELGAVLIEEDTAIQAVVKAPDGTAQLRRYVGRYLDTVHLIHDDKKRAKLQAKLLTTLTNGVQNDDETYKVIGMRDSEFSQYPVHEESMVRYVRGWLKQHRFVFMGCEDETAATIVDLAKQALGMIPIKLDIFEKLQDIHYEEQQEALAKHPLEPSGKKRKRGKIDLMAIPGDESTEETAPNRPLVGKQSTEEELPVQLAMF